MFGWVDEGPHEATSDDSWSETAALMWYDREAGVGGFHHLGQFVNRGSGNHWHGLVTKDRTYYRSWAEDGPLRPQDRAPHFLAVSEGRMAFSFEQASRRLAFSDENTDVRLNFDDFYPICPSRGNDGGDVEHEVSPHHYESSGRAHGSARIGDRTYEINNALYHRDHSWGPRDYSKIVGHRWIVGTAGEELSFCAVTLVGSNNFVAGGYVVRNGERHPARSTEITVALESDGLTVRSADVRLTFDSVPDLTFTCAVVGGFLWGQAEFVCTDQLATFTTDDGLSGICCVELSLGQQPGNPGLVGAATGVATQDGFGELARAPIRSRSW